MTAIEGGSLSRALTSGRRRRGAWGGVRRSTYVRPRCAAHRIPAARNVVTPVVSAMQGGLLRSHQGEPEARSVLAYGAAAALRTVSPI